MLEYNLDIEKRSTWILTTQPAAAKTMPFYLSEIGKFYAGKEYYTRRSGREGYYLVLTEAGGGRLRMGERDHDLPAGTALLIPCAPLHNYHTVGERWVHYWMHLDGSGVEPYSALLERPVTLPRPGEEIRRFDSMIDRAHRIDVAAAARISHGISGILTAMVVAGLSSDAPGTAAGHDSVGAALRYLRENYQQPITIDELAAVANLSKYHFVRLFTRHVGVTPYNYLIHYRVNQSKRLLCATGDSVGEIARQVGYQSASNYVGQFRHITGMTPAQFRKSNLNYLELSGKEG